ncbi:MAG: hypothetical protein HC849_24290 [Oscillatoriales cyanobacterium RU_3_3]|nr:hypothetical protein [Oscillatoriales cyanobacterium RU_3_3]NJR21327.1 hypothetical protein [Richelia sp. CSU_2_1]
MKHLDPQATIRPTPEAKGYLDTLKNNGAFGRMVDAYVFAAAYALKNNVEISPVLPRGRQDLVYMGIVDEDVRLALEAGVHTVQKRNGKPEPKDSREVLEIVMQYAEAGLKLLKERWQGKTGVQIQDDIRKIISQ